MENPVKMDDLGDYFRKHPGGGFTRNFLYFTPTWWNDPITTHILSHGLQPTFFEICLEDFGNQTGGKSWNKLSFKRFRRRKPELFNRPIRRRHSRQPEPSSWWGLQEEIFRWNKIVPTKKNWLVATQIFFHFHPYLGKIPILTSIFFKGVGSTTNQRKTWSLEGIVFFQEKTGGVIARWIQFCWEQWTIF